MAGGPTDFVGWVREATRCNHPAVSYLDTHPTNPNSQLEWSNTESTTTGNGSTSTHSRATNDDSDCSMIKSGESLFVKWGVVLQSKTVCSATDSRESHPQDQEEYRRVTAVRTAYPTSLQQSQNRNRHRNINYKLDRNSTG